MKFHNRRFILVAFLMLVTAFASSEERTKGFTDGMLDLSLHDFKKNGLVDIVGQWRFYPNELLNPSEVESRERTASGKPFTIRFPGIMEKQSFGGRKGPHFGIGTCVLDIRLPPEAADLYFRTELIQCSSRVFIDGKPYGEAIVAESSDPYRIPPNRPTYYPLGASRGSTRVILQISNYWDSFGTGMQTAPKLVTERVMARKRSFGIGYESFLVGILLFAAIYHLMLFLIQRRDKAILIFAFIALDVVFRQLSISEKFWLSELGLRHFQILRVEHGSAYLACALFSLYFRFLYPRESRRLPCVFLFALGLALLAFPIFAPPRVFSALILPMHAYIVLTAANATYTLFRAIRAREPQAIVMFVGLISLALPTALDILTTYGHSIGRYMMPLGLLPFLAAQSFLLAKRYTRDATEAESLRVTNARLTKLDETKTNFLANVSHELRTPVTLIKAPVEAILAGEYGDAVPKDHPVFSLMRGNAERLTKLIENLLSLTRLESVEPYELTPTDLTKALPAYMDEFSALAAKAGVLLEGEWDEAVPIVARIDPKAFETIFFNLMANAIKYTRKGGTVTVRLRRVTEGKALARVEIRDTGIGIPKDQLERIFSRYTRVYDEERMHYDGTGLGLAIARGTAKAIGGTIWATSVPGSGSSFFLDLPASDGADESARAQNGIKGARAASVGRERREGREEPATVPRADIARADFSGATAAARPRILVVEDHDEMRRFIANGLSRDYETAEASDGEKALAMIRAQPIPDLVISDIMMPNLDGIGLLKALRADSRLDSIPLIFLTARDDPDERIRQLRNGVVDYIAKPFSIEELRARISAVLRLRDAERRVLHDRVQSAILGPRVREYPEGSLSADQGEILALLTSRETEILGFVVAGMSDKEIATKLGISTRTASNHVGSLLRKTGLSSRQSIKIRFGDIARTTRRETRH
jgi:signal transduction histidine kinase/DNA-binding NarL/FixJ family response regulator